MNVIPINRIILIIYIDDRIKCKKITIENLKKGIFHYTNRLGWCNSDLGFGFTLYRLGKVLQDESLLKRAKEISYDTIKRQSFINTGVNSMYMCHGSTGIAQLYKRIYELSTDPIYINSYEYWVNITYHYLIKDAKRDINPDDINLLSGYLAPILLLYCYANNCNSNWDKIFLLS